MIKHYAFMEGLLCF